MRPWTRRSLWSQSRLRRFARSLPAISSLAPSARWRRTSIGGEFAASRGGCRTARPPGGGAEVGGGGPPLSSKPSLTARGRARRGMPSMRTARDRGPAGLSAACGPRPLLAAPRGRLRGSSALLSGRLFDNRGNRMSPTHTNKGGARYRYYVSQAVLQGKPPPPGLVSRVPAAETEALVVAALRSHLNARGGGEGLPDNDRDLIERHLERVTLTPNHLELRLRQIIEPAQAHDPANTSAGRPTASVTTLAVPPARPSPPLHG